MHILQSRIRVPTWKLLLYQLLQDFCYTNSYRTSVIQNCLQPGGKSVTFCYLKYHSPLTNNLKTPISFFLHIFASNQLAHRIVLHTTCQRLITTPPFRQVAVTGELRVALVVFRNNNALTHKNRQVKSNIMMSKCFKLLNLVANSQGRQGFIDTKTLRAAVSVSS